MKNNKKIAKELQDFVANEHEIARLKSELEGHEAFKQALVEHLLPFVQVNGEIAVGDEMVEAFERAVTAITYKPAFEHALAALPAKKQTAELIRFEETCVKHSTIKGIRLVA
jgi:hypothetical protein